MSSLGVLDRRDSGRRWKCTRGFRGCGRGGVGDDGAACVLRVGGARAAHRLPSARSLGGLILNKTLSQPQFRGMAVFAPIMCGRYCGHHWGLAARGWENGDHGALGSALNTAGRPGCGPQGLPWGTAALGAPGPGLSPCLLAITQTHLLASVAPPGFPFRFTDGTETFSDIYN